MHNNNYHNNNIDSKKQMEILLEILLAKTYIHTKTTEAASDVRSS